MFKIYLSSNTQEEIFGVGSFGNEAYRMRQITDEIEKELLRLKRYIVYNSQETIEENIILDSNNKDVDLHIVVRSNYDKVIGIRCIPKTNCIRSNGVAKEIYKNLHSIYYDKRVDDGVLYESKNKEINSVKSPALIVEVGCNQNINDANWIVQNIYEISRKIAYGIDKGMYLKLCWGDFLARGIDFRQKEVINITNGKIMGFVVDVDAELNAGAIKSIVVAQVGKVLKSLGGKNNVTIPWSNVKLIGEDVILVEI